MDLFKNEIELEKNFESIINKIDVIINTWYYRYLTLMGKVLIINTLIASLFVYKFQVFPVLPEHVISKVEQVMEKFIWQDKRAKLPLKILQCSKEQGGLGLVDLRKRHLSLLCEWVKIIQTH